MAFDHGLGRPLSAFSPTWSPTWVIEDLWQARGVNMLCGAPRARKSTLNAYLTVCALTGSPAFGLLKITPVVRAAVFLGEGILEAEATRFYEAFNGLGLDHARYAQQLTLFGPEMALRFDPTTNVAPVRASLKAEGYDFVSFDPLVNFHSQDENTSVMATVMANITSFTEFATVSLPHHIPKPMAGAPERSLSHQARGHSSIAGYTAVNMILERVGSSNEHTIRTDAKYTEKHGSLNLRFKNGVWLIKEVAADKELREAITEAVHSNPHITRDEIVGQVKRRRTDVLETLNDMILKRELVGTHELAGTP